MSPGPCLICKAYFARRAEVLAPAIARRAFVLLISPPVVAREYAAGVHARHMAGLPLSTRRRTPDEAIEGGKRIHVSRCCNGCGNGLGDVREDELDAAVAGHPLPDVRLECGCSDEAVAS